ncbi:MAG: histidine triad nucleotide-binding protein [Oligoflexia bacterium]|nr:histidine triad nucleotide-binding protein [Oligoflexia bacterium]MBF0366375.1 histidine triad nucleotide-binding protein [Oligoflexia bacterium]
MKQHFDEHCIFCKIIKGEIPSQKVYEDEQVTAFKDIHPAAPIHLLFVHKNHTQDINHTLAESPQDILDLFAAIKSYTQKERLDDRGFRIITNLGVDGGQSVFHTHFHLLAGKKLPFQLA